MNPTYSHAAIVLPTGKMDDSIAFYQDKLGFDLTFTWETPISYAVLKSNHISIHLSLLDNFQGPKYKHTALYIFVHDIDKIYQDLIKKGVKIRGDFKERDYKMKDFDVVDPAGNVITFGKEG